MLKVGNKVGFAADRYRHGEIVNVGKELITVKWEQGDAGTYAPVDLVLCCSRCGSASVRDVDLHGRGHADVCWSCGLAVNVEMK